MVLGGYIGWANLPGFVFFFGVEEGGVNRAGRAARESPPPHPYGLNSGTLVVSPKLPRKGCPSFADSSTERSFDATCSPSS